MRLPSESKRAPLDEDNTMVDRFRRMQQQRRHPALHKAGKVIREQRKPRRHVMRPLSTKLLGGKIE